MVFMLTVTWNKWSDTTQSVLAVLNIWIELIKACVHFIFVVSANKILGHKNHGTFKGLVKFSTKHAQEYLTFGKRLLTKEYDRIKHFCSTENSIHGMIVPCTGYSGHNP